jgi:drug/metabolite transporter (DMT)-like permease
MSYRTEWICIVLVGIFWGGYPLVARLSSFGGPFASLLLALLSCIPISAIVAWTGDWTGPTRAQLWPVAIAGVMQGVGLVAFLRLATGKLEASVAIPISDVGMLIVTTVGAMVFFQESVTGLKLLGLAFLFTGIWLLRPA